MLNTKEFHHEHCCTHTLTMREKIRIMDFSNKWGKKGDIVNTKALVYSFLFPTTSGNIAGMCKNSRGDHIISSATVQRQCIVYQVYTSGALVHASPCVLIRPTSRIAYSILSIALLGNMASSKNSGPAAFFLWFASIVLYQPVFVFSLTTSAFCWKGFMKSQVESKEWWQKSHGTKYRCTAYLPATVSWVLFAYHYRIALNA